MLYMLSLKCFSNMSVTSVAEDKKSWLVVMVASVRKQLAESYEESIHCGREQHLAYVRARAKAFSLVALPPQLTFLQPRTLGRCI